jgi:hypothetical protein
MSSVGLFGVDPEDLVRVRYGTQAVFEVRSAFEELVDEREREEGRGWVVDVLVSRALLVAQACETSGLRALSDALCDWISSFDEPSWVEAALRERVESELRKCPN